MYPHTVTYYNDFMDVNSVNNPLVGDIVQMQFKGFFYKNWTRNELNFSNVGYGLKKTINDQGYIYCNDSSKLFSMNSGYVGMLLSFPYSFVDGVYQLLINDNQTLNEYILWGVNIGQYQNAQPGFYAALTPRGIEFTIWTSRAKSTLSDTFLTLNANEDIFIEFMWSSTGIDDYLVRAVLKVNDSYSAISNIPMEDDDINNLSFCALNTPFSYSNLECTIRKLIIGIASEELRSSSSASESSSSYSESSYSSASSSSSTEKKTSSSSSKTSQSGTSTSESSSSSSSNEYSTSSSSESLSDSSSSITVSFSSLSLESDSSPSSTSLSSDSSPSSTSSSSVSSDSSTSSTSSSSPSSESSYPHCNNCDPSLLPSYDVTIAGFAGGCSIFNGSWTVAWTGLWDNCYWVYNIDANCRIVLWWDGGTNRWYVFMYCDDASCGVTVVGADDWPCDPTNNGLSYTGGVGTVFVSAP